MQHLMDYLDQNAPKSGYVSLIADVPADKLYEQFGFAYTAPRSVGMYKWFKWSYLHKETEAKNERFLTLFGFGET